MSLNGKSILITGGTGSFGKMFSKIVLNKYPDVKKIIIYSRDEFKQFEMSNMPEFKPFLSKMRFFIGDVRDRERLTLACENVDVLIHAAALKQVPACEYNPFEAIKTNVLGAQNVIDAAITRRVPRVVALSTDKACAPVNLYGATKLCSDKLFIAGNAYAGPHDVRISVVRYGNVAGSRGSVIPFFKDLVANKAKEIPVTDNRMTRFWLKLEEACDMVMYAIDNMLGGELYVRKIPSMRILELAKTVAPDLPTKEIGIRPGEKIHEVMITREDARNTLEFEDHFIIQPELDWWKGKGKLCGGKPVADDFEYSSGTNTQWLTQEDMRRLIDEL